MQPRREPLLWLQCLALGAIPLELLLIRLVLAGADPGPVPGVERFLIWGVGVLAPAVALWRRPADWGSLLLVRQPLASRSGEQLRISASHGGLSSRIAVAIAAASLLPVLWWLDDSAVLVSEFSPVSGQSRLVTLLLVSPLSALIVWQVQQLVQAAQLLLGSTPPVGAADATFRADALATQRTSLGLQLLNLPGLEWPEPVVEPSNQGADEGMRVDDTEPEPDDTTLETRPENVSSDDVSENEESEEESSDINLAIADESADAEARTLEPVNAGGQVEEESSAAIEGIDPASDQEADEALRVDNTESEPDDTTLAASTENLSSTNVSDNKEPEEERSAINPVTAEVSEDAEPEASLEPVDPQAQVEEPDDIGADDTDQSSVAATASLPVEPEQPGEEQESTALDTEISQVDTVAGGSTEGHREQAEPSRGKESEPEQSS